MRTVTSNVYVTKQEVVRAVRLSVESARMELPDLIPIGSLSEGKSQLFFNNDSVNLCLWSGGTVVDVHVGDWIVVGPDNVPTIMMSDAEFNRKFKLLEIQVGQLGEVGWP